MNQFNSIIPIERFADVFNRIGWLQSNSKSGKYQVWTSAKNNEMWTVIPIDRSQDEYRYYQEKNIPLITQELGLEPTDLNIKDIYSQLISYNYKISNRIVNKESTETIPFELAESISRSNIDAFRYYYKVKLKGRVIPIENIQLNHTERGSFIIPISISVQPENDSLFPLAHETNIVIRNYLKTIESIINTPRTSEKKFADNLIEQGIDSKIVKTFISDNNSYAEIKDKYKNKITELTITSSGSPILDFNLPKDEKIYPIIDMIKAKVVPPNFIEYLESREVEANTYSIDASGVKINVEVDSLDQNGTVKFSVFSVDGRQLSKPFKARSTKLTKNTLNNLTDAFKSREIIEVSGDISKQKGRVGEIVADKYNIKKPESNLFQEEKL